MPHDPSAEFVALRRAVAGRISRDRELAAAAWASCSSPATLHWTGLVAIKLLPPALAGRAEIRNRFLREAPSGVRDRYTDTDRNE